MENYGWYILYREGEVSIKWCLNDDPTYGQGTWSIVAGPFALYKEATSSHVLEELVADVPKALKAIESAFWDILATPYPRDTDIGGLLFIL